MLNVSLPTITRELGTDVATVQWVATGYLLVISSLLLTGGRLGEGGRRFGGAGATTLFLGLAALLLGLSQGRIWGWGSAPVLGLFAAAVGLAVAFVRIELRAPEPMLPLDVFRSRVFATANACSFIVFTAISHSFFLMPFFLIGGQ